MTSSPSHLAGLALARPSDGHATPGKIDHAAVQRASRELLRALGADVDSEGLRETPRRMADAYTELLTPQPFRPTTFPNDEGYDELIVARAIPFHSLCMHHLLPFHGVAHVAARGAEIRRADRDLGAARAGPRRRSHTPGVPGPDHGERP